MGTRKEVPWIYPLHITFELLRLPSSELRCVDLTRLLATTTFASDKRNGLVNMGQRVLRGREGGKRELLRPQSTEILPRGSTVIKGTFKGRQYGICIIININMFNILVILFSSHILFRCAMFITIRLL
jgi:hypothetical protein